MNIQAIRVLDFSFVDGKIYAHYHFGAIPLGAETRRSSMILLKSVEKSMSLNNPFHLQSFGTKSKQGIFSYLAKRSAGLYKYDEAKNHDWNTGEGRLRKDIEAGNYIKLAQIISPEMYIKNFYKRRHYVTIGGLPHGSILTDNSLSQLPDYCPIHGDLERKDIRVEIIFDSDAPPPLSGQIFYPEMQIEVVRMR